LKKTEINIIKNRIDRGSEYWKKENKDKFDRFRRYLQIKHYADTKVQKDRITVPYIHAIIRTKLPAIFIRNPKYLVKPKGKTALNGDGQDTVDTINNQPVMQALMNYMPDEIGMEDECKLAVLDYLGFGMGIVKVAYEFECEGEDDDELKILADRFYVKRIAYPKGDFIWDPESTTGLAGARWCAEKMTSPLQDLKDSKFFKNTADLKPNAKIEKDLASNNSNKPTADEERVEYWLYWEKNRYGKVTKYAYVVVDQKIELASGNNPFQHADWPYEEAKNYMIPDYTFPVGDIEPIETQQNELDKAETIMFNHMKRFIQKYKMKKGALDSKGISAMESPESVVVEMAGDMSELMALDNPSVSSTVPLAVATIKSDMDNSSGINEFKRGAGAQTKKTATEVNATEEGSKQRSDDALRDVEKFMKNIGRKLMQLIQQYATEDMVIKIAGDTDEVKNFPIISPEDIQGEYDLEVEPHSTAPIDLQIQKRQAMDLYNIMAKDPDVMASFDARNELRRIVLTAFDVKNIEPFITNPIEQTQNQIEAMAGGMPEEGGEGMPGAPMAPQGPDMVNPNMQPASPTLARFNQ